jgi:hypothetical protein
MRTTFRLAFEWKGLASMTSNCPTKLVTCQATEANLGRRPKSRGSLTASERSTLRRPFLTITLMLAATFWAVVATAFGHANTTDLQCLYEAHQWFQLRRQLDGPRLMEDSLYRGAVAAAFNERANAEFILREVIAKTPNSDEAYQAHEWLTYLYLRNGLMQDVVKETQAKVAARPDRRNRAEDSLMAEFSHFPNQRSGHISPWRGTYSMRDGLMSVPVQVNGKAVQFIVDTDANVSTISKKQALALGMHLLSGDATTRGITGNGSHFDVAVAEELRIGSNVLRDVAFQVMPDAESLFTDMPMGARGLLGIPVWIALRTVRWTQDGSFEVGFSGQQPPLPSNLCFDGSDPITEVLMEPSRRFPMLFDSGAEETELWPPFAKIAPDIATAGVEHARRLTGFGGDRTVQSAVLPAFSLTIGGLAMPLSKLNLLKEPTWSSSAWYAGRLGIDAMGRAREITIDFVKMRLQLR